MPFCYAELRTPKLKPERYPKQLSTLGDHLRARRIELGMLQSQVADEIGVHELTITNWERNESRPAVNYMPAIIGFLGYNPAPQAGSFSERVQTVRRRQGLNQREFARVLGVDPATIRDWERGRRTPQMHKLELFAKFHE